ncbi:MULTISPECIES: sensor histidine kinase [unclassified Paenibacillus]|uniref:cache domain-containing sensor histidine kinase n=1 Tax=unclassified Paenibacillus TaxID=185978 RepID=UPI0009562CA8|nr:MULTISPECIES: sensor histidine kinase [unclassified Paenibacillus]ASS66126.1 sensor histidine kinase [Paenibacillus sp. RUD330]SIQ11800.1 Sensor histidine kinase YesM [Paenibacillus sp. RU4X]SIQ33275.1 Sensor histidine kinase YesM [Paenibacillus sp. RU4T]
MIKASLKLASSFRNRMILIFFAITIVPFILFASYAYTKSVEGIQKANETFSMGYLEQAQKNVEAYLSQLNDQINDLIGDKTLQTLLERPPASAQDEEAFAVNMLNLVYQKKKQIDALQLRVYPLPLQAYPTYMRTLGESPGIGGKAWFAGARESSVPTWHLSLHEGPGGSPLLVYVKTFTGLHDRVPRGLVVTDLADSHLSRFFSPTKQLEGQKFLVIGQGGEVLFDSSRNETTGQTFGSAKLAEQRSIHTEGELRLSLHGKEHLATFVNMESLPWTIVSLTPMSALTKPVEDLNRLLVFFLIAYLICSVGVVAYITLTFTQPVFQLVRLMRRLEEGDFKLAIPHQKRQDEIGWLYRGFSSILRKIEGLIEQSTRAERNKKELEFQVLSHQINPHFLYNTLESIRWKAENHGRSDIGEMVSALGNLLRLSLNQGKDITTVGREIEQVKAFVQIEQARIGQPLRVVYFFDEEMLALPFMRLLLQPLVENAIQHSIRGNFEKGKVLLSGHVEEGDMVIAISDNGKGIPDSVLRQLDDGEDGAGGGEGKRPGVGLRNVNERLKLYFGNDYKLQIDTGEGKGTKITIRHPILPAGEPGDEDGDGSERRG